MSTLTNMIMTIFTAFSFVSIQNPFRLVNGFSFRYRLSFRQFDVLNHRQSYCLISCEETYSVKQMQNYKLRHVNYLYNGSHSLATRLHSSTSKEPPVKNTTCKYCKQSFDSRNAFFRHVRSDNDCRNRAMVEAGNVRRYDELVKGIFNKAAKRSIVMQIGYRFNDFARDPKNANINSSLTVYETIKRSFIQALCDIHGLRGFDINLEWFDDTFTFTQASAAKLRPVALTQDNDCNAAGDVITANFRRDNANVEDIILKVNEILAREETRRCGLDVRVLSTEPLTASSSLHAEGACTQRVYHYLIPLDWLPQADKMKEWCIELETRKRQESSAETFTSSKTSRFGIGKRGHVQRSSGPSTMKELKAVLKLITSTIDDGYKQKTAGRFGSLNSKDKMCWHNFADPTLEGLASPNNSPVWRSIDRVRNAEIVFASNDSDSLWDDILLAIEMRGDGFLRQMVRRIIGTVVAVSNGWLPKDFFYWATRPDIVIETPIAPEGFTYMAGARFDFNELVLRRALFRTKRDGMKCQREWVVELHNAINNKRSRCDEDDWLNELKNTISPRIHKQLDDIKNTELLRESLSKSREYLGDALPSLQTREKVSYQKVLSSLRQVVDSGKWPTTSMARSRIIRKSEFQDTGLVNKSGSFTVVNMNVDHGLGNNLPLGNELFPDLSEFVFDLEKQLCIENFMRRPASSHCAINRNAQFTPHVDSGRGFGQSLSMIVGLGDYVGGGLYIEGNLKVIRYNPVEFDGWRLRHWTEPFEGERYSLVWFTPEKTRSKAQDTNKNSDKLDQKSDIVNAKEIASRHATDVLPTYPLLEYREYSTDTLVVIELLDPKKGVYRFPHQISSDTLNTDVLSKSFSGHEFVLDIGAHIGVFVRHCLGVGCKRIKAFEPDPDNFELLKRNSIPLDASCEAVELHNIAVAQVDSSTVQHFTRGVDQNGVQNTWRGSLSNYSHYKSQESKKGDIPVHVIPFFGPNGALESGITLVKLDCEGAEIDILCSEQASHKSNWLDVTHLVFEWSFTKEKKIMTFHRAIHNLERAGFGVTYEGQGSFWDDPTKDWPFFTDLVVFATRSPE